jgi:hypothetical protein
VLGRPSLFQTCERQPRLRMPPLSAIFGRGFQPLKPYAFVSAFEAALNAGDSITADSAKAVQSSTNHNSCSRNPRPSNPAKTGAASVGMVSARTRKRGAAPQPSQRRGSPFQERIAINTAISPNMSPKPCTRYWLSFRNNGDIPSDVAHQTKSTNHPSQVCASL